jgi:hypothetical protein
VDAMFAFTVFIMGLTRLPAVGKNVQESSETTGTSSTLHQTSIECRQPQFSMKAAVPPGTAMASSLMSRHGYRIAHALRFLCQQ